MKLEPVFVVAPQPHLRGVPTRRAFLIAGSTFTLGTVVGGACGYSIAVATQSAGAPAEEVIPPSGDPELDELRRLAVKAPIDELLEKRLVFTACVNSDYPTDAVLWRGVGRLCDAVVGNYQYEDRRLFAAALAQMIDRGDATCTQSLKSRIPELRRTR